MSTQESLITFHRTPRWMMWGVLSLVVLCAGYGVAWFFIDGSPRPQLTAYLIAGALKQGGAIGLLSAFVCALTRLLPVRKQTAVRAKLRRWAVRAATLTVIFFVTSEVVMRIVYRDGESFGSHVGPLVQRFERNFKFNRYDGPSRGPEVHSPKSKRSLRILIMGDSISWGQGIKNEQDLFPTRLLEHARTDVPEADMAVLATPGREIDGHLDQLRKWGTVIDPDVIIYQWYVNDVEVDKSGRPEGRRPWRRFFLHPVLAQNSYTWFSLDYSLDLLLPSGPRSYAEYIDQDFNIDAPGWHTFCSLFTTWVSEGRHITPRILLVLYPSFRNGSSVPEFQDIYQRTIQLAKDQKIHTLDLMPIFAEYKDNYSQLYATSFDAHPSVKAHALVAKAIDQTTRSLWPELFERVQNQ